MDNHGPGCSSYGTDALKRRRFDLRAVRRSAVLREIEERSSDPKLSAVTVATLLRITPRYVHLLLKDTGRRFSHHLLEKRLEKAAALLRYPEWSNRPIIDIAAEAGFNSLSHFGRAFRQQFGATPSEVRKAAPKEDR